MTGISDRFRLDGKAAVITGASSGLGRAFALALAEAGADVALGARREEQLAETVALVERTGRRAIAVRTDVHRPKRLRAVGRTNVRGVWTAGHPGQQRRSGVGDPRP